MTLQLSPDLDAAALAEAFARSRRLHIPGLMAPGDAERVADVLEAETRWKTTVAAGGAFFELPLDGRRAADPAKQSWLDEAGVDGSSPLTQYIFDTRRLGIEHTEVTGGAPDLADDVLDWLNSPAVLSFLRTVTGD